MITKASVLKGFEKLFATKTVVSISGASGTGKTTLALQLVGELLTKSKPYLNSCVWVQASESFPKKRLESLFPSPEILNYLKSNIFTIPKHKIGSYEAQLEVLQCLSRGVSVLPPFTKIIVIDNISNHLRHQISQISEKKHVFSVLNHFFETQLEPLIFFCQRENITLILIHEVSYNPKLNLNVPFFHSLYEKIDSIQIKLEKDSSQELNSIEISLGNSQFCLGYRLLKNGFEFLTYV